MASSLRLVGREVKFFHFSCKFLLMGLFGFRKDKKVNPLEFAVRQLIVLIDRLFTIHDLPQTKKCNVWLTPVVFQPNLKYF